MAALTLSVVFTLSNLLNKCGNIIEKINDSLLHTEIKQFRKYKHNNSFKLTTRFKKEINIFLITHWLVWLISMLIFSLHCMLTSIIAERVEALDKPRASVGVVAAELEAREGLVARDELGAGEGLGALDEPGTSVGFGAAELEVEFSA